MSLKWNNFFIWDCKSQVWSPKIQILKWPVMVEKLVDGEMTRAYKLIVCSWSFQTFNAVGWRAKVMYWQIMFDKPNCRGQVYIPLAKSFRFITTKYYLHHFVSRVNQQGSDYSAKNWQKRVVGINCAVISLQCSPIQSLPKCEAKTMWQTHQNTRAVLDVLRAALDKDLANHIPAERLRHCPRRLRSVCGLVRLAQATWMADDWVNCCKDVSIASILSENSEFKRHTVCDMGKLQYPQCG